MIVEPTDLEDMYRKALQIRQACGTDQLEHEDIDMVCENAAQIVDTLHRIASQNGAHFV